MISFSLIDYGDALDSWPLTVGTEYDDEAPQQLCGARVTYVSHTGASWPKACDWPLYGGTIREIRERLAEHVVLCEHLPEKDLSWARQRKEKGK